MAAATKCLAESSASGMNSASNRDFRVSMASETVEKNEDGQLGLRDRRRRMMIKTSFRLPKIVPAKCALLAK